MTVQYAINLQSAEEPSSPFTEQATVLLVDDIPDNLNVLGELLSPLYRVQVATSGERALQMIQTTAYPDLILLDISMPGLDGYEVLKKLKTDTKTRNIPVIFVTAINSPENEERGLKMGAVDYITKPFRPSIVLARVRTQLEVKRGRDILQKHNSLLEAEVNHRMRENLLIQEVSIHALARLAEIRDPETGHHILRTQGYVRQLAINLKRHPNFAELLTDRYIQLLVQSAPLHDIGKVGIPDAILLKPGPLTEDEWEVMKTHTCLGSAAIELAEQDAERPVEFLQLAKEIARWHHEKWDGSGYPDGLIGKQIPVSARLMAIADVFDALISRRTYKDPISYTKARDIITAGRGKHFDPDVTDTFLQNFSAMQAIAEQNQS